PSAPSSAADHDDRHVIYQVPACQIVCPVENRPGDGLHVLASALLEDGTHPPAIQRLLAMCSLGDPIRVECQHGTWLEGDAPLLVLPIGERPNNAPGSLQGLTALRGRIV